MAIICETQDKFGFIGVKTINNDGQIHRRTITPGELIDGVFVPTDVSGETAEIQALASETWTPEIVSSLREFLLSQYVPPASSELFPPLAPWQFRAMLEIGGIAQTVDDAVASIADPVQKAIAKARLDYSLQYHRNDPLIAMLAPVVGLTDAQIDTLWAQAAKL